MRFLMKSALDRLMAAVEDDIAGRQWFISFMFRYSGYVFDYQGRYYAYVYPEGKGLARNMDEYCWGSYEEMFDAVISQTGKSVREMLAELSEHDLEIVFDVPVPPGQVAPGG